MPVTSSGRRDVSAPAPIRRELKGRVFDISRGCIDDGPGLRTVVFLKGCNLHCPWCHNPEGRSFMPEIAFDPDRCIDCGRCRLACPHNRRRECSACGRCAEVCPAGARRVAGQNQTVAALVSDLCRDQDFFVGTDGGVTFSGGEPLTQPDFLFACADALNRKHIHVALETAGFWPQSLLSEVARCFDLVLFDLKHVDENQWRDILGCSSVGPLDNLRNLLASNCEVGVRVTLIPGFNNARSHLEAIAEWLAARSDPPEVTLQPFHRLARAKQRLFGVRYEYANATPTSPIELSDAAALFLRKGLRVTGFQRTAG